jgi:hypothetical protein
MRKAIVIISSLGIVCVIFFGFRAFLSSPNNTFSVTKKDGKTARITDMRFCSEGWIWDTRYGSYDFKFDDGAENTLPRSFDGITALEIIGGGDDNGEVGKAGKMLRYNELYRHIEHDSELLEINKNSPNYAKKEELKTKESLLEVDKKELKEIEQSFRPLRFRVTFSNGETLEGQPDNTIFTSANYVVGKAEHGKMKIYLKDLISIVRENK